MRQGPTVTCTDLRTGLPALTFPWDFGDGSPTSTLAGPAHTFGEAGTFTVSLTATDSLGWDAGQQAVEVRGACRIILPLVLRAG